MNDAHFACFRLDFNLGHTGQPEHKNDDRVAYFVRGNKVRLKLSPPLEGALKTFLPIFELPLGSSHIPGDGIRLAQPLLLIVVVRIGFREHNGLCILGELQYQKLSN